MPTAMSEDGSAPALGGPPALPECIKDPEIPKTGWERIRELFQPNEQGSYPEEVQNVAKGALTGLTLGWVYGGIPAARLSKERFIQQSQADVYCHRVEAVRAAHNAALRGFIRYGWRWGWRVAAFATIFNSVSTGLSVYRDEVVLSHYAAAGGVTGGLFRIHLGLRGLLGGSLIGVLLGVPAGALISGLQALSGENVREKKQRERRNLYHHKLEEWDARLQITDGVLQEMGAAGIESAETHVEKIDELLQLPRNPESDAEEG